MSFRVVDNVGYRTNNAVKPPSPIDYESRIYQKDLQYERPPFSFQTQKWEEQAQERMSAESKGYIVGNAGEGETNRKNSEAFNKWSIVPSRLVKTTELPDLATTVLGMKSPWPIAIAPVGVQRIFNPEGEVASAKAAEREGVPYIMSTASSTSIEDVAKANGHGTRLFQLYWPSNEHDDITVSMLSRAKTLGFSALFTLDTYILGWRQFLKDNWQGPIVLKGIQSVADAKKAVEMGIDGIVVSNHGGRQVDGGVSSLSMLPQIVDAVGDKIDIFFDSGIRCGADIAKALALGAKMCLVGRPYVYGLALGGEEGFSHVLKSLIGDLELTLHLAEIESARPEHLNREVLIREDEL